MKVVMNVDNDEEFRRAVTDMVNGALKGEVREQINEEVERLVNETLTESRVINLTNKMVDKYTGYAQETIKHNIDWAIEQCIRKEIKEAMKNINLTAIVADVLNKLFESRGLDFRFVQDNYVQIPEPRIVKGKN